MRDILARYLSTSFTLVILLLASCTGDTNCRYYTQQRGWTPTTALPTLPDYPPQKGNWFTNPKGDFLYCQTLISNSICLGDYHLFEVTTKKRYKKREITCLN